VSDAAISFAVLGGVVVLFVLNRLPVELVAVGAALVLAATGVLTLDEAVAGFGDPTVVFIATLFVVSEALDATGVVAWAGQRLVAATRGDRRRLLVLTMLLVAGLTAVVSVNGAVAALVPMVVLLSTRLGEPPSLMLMPLAFAAHAGSLLALTGTPVNVLVSEASEDATGQGFGFFGVTLVGVPLVAATVLVVVLLGRRTLPRRTAEELAPDLSGHAGTLAEQYALAGDEELITRDDGVVEAVIPPRSPALGRRVFTGMAASSGDLVVRAVQRHGRPRPPGDQRLEVGDTLLLGGTWAALERETRLDPDILVVDPPQLIRRQAVPMGRGAGTALAIVAAMVLLLATGAVPAAAAGLLAAGALVVTRVLSIEEAYRSISWTIVVLAAGMIPMSAAMQSSGAADDVAQLVVRLVGDAGPYALSAGLFLVTAAFGQLISNLATALIVIPIAVSVAVETGVSAQPLLMTVNVAATASLLTPIATAANMMVMGPGGYRFGDYWRLGLPLMAVFFLVGVYVTPVFWPF
jgi:di/tricarboxylate transporter